MIMMMMKNKWRRRREKERVKRERIEREEWLEEREIGRSSDEDSDFETMIE